MLPSVGTATLSWTHSEFVDCFSVVRSRGLQTSIYHVKYWSASYWSVTFHHTWFGSRPGEESGRYCTYWWSFVLTHKLLFWNWSQSLVVFLCRGNFPLCRHVYLFKHFSVQAESTRSTGTSCRLIAVDSDHLCGDWILINEWKQLWAISVQSTFCEKAWERWGTISLIRFFIRCRSSQTEAPSRPCWVFLFLVETHYD